MTDAPPPDGGLRPSGTDAEKLRSVYYFHKEGLPVIRPEQGSAKISSLNMTRQSDAGTANGTPNGGSCYLFGVLYPLLYLLSVPRGRQHRFLRFHCFQCLLLFALLLPLLFMKWKPGSFISVALIVGWLFAMIQARRGKMFHLPLLGYLAERLA